jgi:hypothetical protein
VTISSGLASKPAAMVSDGLASKPVAMVSSGLTSKPVATIFSGLASKPVATIFFGFASKSVVGFFIEPQNQGGGGFSGLGLKTGNHGLMIWASKSPRRFLGFSIKTKRASICQLHHKTDGGRSAWDTHRDLAACFMWKQFWLGFSSLTSRLSKARRWVVHVAPSLRLRRSQVKDEWVNAMGCIGSIYPIFIVFNVLVTRDIIVI